MRILLFGCNGQVGWELQRSLATLGEVIALDFDSKSLSADFSRPDTLAATVRSVRPDVIVNAAAHTAVDKAEAEPDLARTINAEAPGVLAREAAASSSRADRARACTPQRAWSPSSCCRFTTSRWSTTRSPR